MTRTKKTRKKKLRIFRLFLLLFSFLLVIFLGLIFVKPKIDNYLKRNAYHPSPEMLEIINHLELTDKGKKILYSSTPLLEDKEAFNESCTSTDASLYVLGCYTAPGKEIKLYNIQDHDLDGILESTLAHELMHAIWKDLSSSTQEQLQPVLLEAYEANSFLTDELAHYTEEEFYDEVHSRLATEVKDLPQPLEEHYQKYFSDQDKIVSFTEQYKKPLTTLQENIDTLGKKIDALETELLERADAYLLQEDYLNIDIDNFNACADTPGCFSEAIFESQRAELMERISALENEYDDISKQYDLLNEYINEYNQMVIQGEHYDEVMNSQFEKKE